MSRSRLFVLVVAALPITVAAQQSAPPAQVDLAKAQQIVNQNCAACHGADGNSATSANPSLAGQHADYITQQLAHFKAGIRVNPIMQGMVATLSRCRHEGAGRLLLQQKPKGLAAKDAATVKMAQRLFRGGDAATGVPACASCHSPTGAGIPKNYPRVGGQYADYAYAQLKAFKAGERGADKDGKDVNGKIMATIAGRMSDAQMKAVADYMAGLRN